MLIFETDAVGEKEAVELSVNYLGVKPEEVDVQMSRKGASRFLGFGTKTPSLYQVFAKKDITPKEAVVKGVISTILNKMGYEITSIRVEQKEEEKIYVDISAPQAGYIIGKHGRSLESLQFLANILVQNIIGVPPKILLDIENYRERRASHLTDLANNVAQSVIRSGKSRLLDPLNPYERRLIHVALQDNKAVETESEGSGTYKRVRVRRAGNIAHSKRGRKSQELPVDDNIGNTPDNEEMENEVNGNLAENYPEDEFAPDNYPVN